MLWHYSPEPTGKGEKYSKKFANQNFPKSRKKFKSRLWLWWCCRRLRCAALVVKLMSRLFFCSMQFFSVKRHGMLFYCQQQNLVKMVAIFTTYSFFMRPRPSMDLLENQKYNTIGKNSTLHCYGQLVFNLISEEDIKSGWNIVQPD